MKTWMCKLTHPLDSHSWYCLHKEFSAESPRRAELRWESPTQWPNGVASPVALYLRTNKHLTVCWNLFAPREVFFSIQNKIPVHCFFTSLIGMGWTAMRYLGSASTSRREKTQLMVKYPPCCSSHTLHVVIKWWKYITAIRFLTLSAVFLTKLGLVWLSVLWQLNELFGEHAAAVAQDVAFKLGVGVGTQKLHHDGVSCGVDANFHVLTPHWGERKGLFNIQVCYSCVDFENIAAFKVKPQIFWWHQTVLPCGFPPGNCSHLPRLRTTNLIRKVLL